MGDVFPADGEGDSMTRNERLLDFCGLNFILAQVISSSSLLSSLDVHGAVRSRQEPLTCRQPDPTHHLSCPDQDDLKRCHEEDGGNGASHCDPYFQLLPASSDFLQCKAHVHVLEVVHDHGPDVVWDVEKFQSVGYEQVWH